MGGLRGRGTHRGKDGGRGGNVATAQNILEPLGPKCFKDDTVIIRKTQKIIIMKSMSRKCLAGSVGRVCDP